MIYALFGLPGAGKNYVGELIQSRYGISYYDADKSMPERMREYMKKGLNVPQDARDEFYKCITSEIKRLIKLYESIVFSQAIMKNKTRHDLIKEFGDSIMFLLLEADEPLRISRILGREKGEQHIVKLSDLERLTKGFEEPDMPYTKLVNNGDNVALYRSLDDIFNSKIMRPDLNAGVTSALGT